VTRQGQQAILQTGKSPHPLGVWVQRHFFSPIFSIFFSSKKLGKIWLNRPKVSKYSLKSWPEVNVVFHVVYRRTVTHTLKISHGRAARTTASASHRVELKRSHFREGEVRGAQLARVDEHCHRSTCVVSTRWGVPLLKRESWQIISNPMQPQFNNDGAVPVGVPGALVLLPLAPSVSWPRSAYHYVHLTPSHRLSLYLDLLFSSSISSVSRWQQLSFPWTCPWSTPSRV
jgi:hypothetical protein